MAMNFGKLDFAVAFNRQTAFPLDAKSYFESLELANAAAATAEEAGSSNTTYYYGQQIAVVENNVATLYVIQPDKTLKEVGGKVAINENVFTKDADGNLDLLGFADAVAGAQLVKSADGKVSWVKPDTTTVEGLETAVASLQSDVENLGTDVTNLKSAVGTPAEGETAATGLYADIADIGTDLVDLFDRTGALESAIGIPAVEGESEATGIYRDIEDIDNRVTITENNIVNINQALENTYTKEETESAINTAIAAADHLKYKVVTSISDINTAAADADKYIYLVPVESTKVAENNLYEEYMVINGNIELVGEWKVDLSDYATVEALNTLSETVANKVDKEEGKSLVSDTEIAKLATIAENAEENYVKSVDEIQLTVDEAGKLSVIGVDQSLVKGITKSDDTEATLAEALSEKLVAKDLEKYISTDDTLILDCNGVALK